LQNNTIFGHYQPYPIIVLNKVTSTNDYLKELLSNFTPLPQCTAIMAKMQTAGRGQRGTSWATVAGQNLTSSIYLQPANLALSQQFMLTVISSLALYDVVSSYVPKQVFIKWPNDIYIERKKVCGILIENKIAGNTLTSSIIGTGLNVNQTDFAEDLKEKATSLRLAGAQQQIPLLDILQNIQSRLAGYQQLLEQGKSRELLALYNEKLFQKNETRPYQVKNSLCDGKIVGVGHDGLLQMLIDGNLFKYDLKDVVYQL